MKQGVPMEILPESKIHDLLESYPQLEEFLMKLNKKYKKLKNPILRRTVARIATLSQVAMIGGYNTLDLVNMLRAEVGQESLKRGELESDEEFSKEAPDWLKEEPKETIDANELLDREENPLAHTNSLLNSLQKGEIVLVKSDFLPSPLISTFKEKGFDVYCEKVNEDKFLTYIRKN
jgi:uncharacterized protein (DUF2249 family)